MHFTDILQLYARIDQQMLTDLQIDLAHYPKTIAFLQEIVIRKNTAGNGILDRHYPTVTLFL